MIEDNNLKQILKELWNNSDYVPAAYSFRCTELDWFSESIKNNVVAYIAVRLLGLKVAQDLFEDESIREVTDD